jgi:hypothetical protein
MTDRLCLLLDERLDEVVAGTADAALQGHAEACPACAPVVGRQRRLVRLLEALPTAPVADFAAPRLPAGRVLRLTRLRVAAAAVAAAVVVMATARFALHGTRATIRVERVVDLADAPPMADERLLALTAGFEAVAMRRPTEMR